MAPCEEKLAVLTCPRCGGHDHSYEPREIDQVVRVGNDAVVVGVRVGVCGYCGEEAFDDEVAAIYADPDVMQSIQGGARPRDQVAANLAEYQREWAKRGSSVGAAVVEKASGELLGMCGFVEPAEPGYMLGWDAWGQGIVTEAARACLRYGFERLGLERLGLDEISAGALSENLASRRVLEKLGMRPSPNDYFDRNGGVYYPVARARRAGGGPAD